MKMLYVIQMKEGSRVFTFTEDDDKEFKIGFEANNKTFRTKVVKQINQVKRRRVSHISKQLS